MLNHLQVGRQPGIGIALAAVMLVAIPHHQGRVSPVFDVASRLTVVRVKGRTELERRDVTLFEVQPDGIARSLAELGVNVLICGAISQTLQHLLQRDGVRVVGYVCGETEPVLRAFLSRSLDAPEFCLPGCYHRPRVRASHRLETSATRVRTGRSAPRHQVTPQARG